MNANQNHCRLRLIESPIRRVGHKWVLRSPCRCRATPPRAISEGPCSDHSDSRRDSRPNEHSPARRRSLQQHQPTSRSGSISWRFLSHREPGRIRFVGQKVTRGGEPTDSQRLSVGPNIPSTSATGRLCELTHTTLSRTTSRCRLAASAQRAALRTAFRSFRFQS